MGAMPPLNFNQSATSGMSSYGSTFMASGPGDWNVNLAGSGTSAQGMAAGGLPSWMLIAGACVAAYLLLKK